MSDQGEDDTSLDAFTNLILSYMRDRGRPPKPSEAFYAGWEAALSAKSERATLSHGDFVEWFRDRYGASYMDAPPPTMVSALVDYVCETLNAEPQRRKPK